MFKSTYIKYSKNFWPETLQSSKIMSDNVVANQFPFSMSAAIRFLPDPISPNRLKIWDESMVHNSVASIPAKAIERNSPNAGNPVESFDISVNGWIEVTINAVMPSYIMKSFPWKSTAGSYFGNSDQKYFKNLRLGWLMWKRQEWLLYRCSAKWSWSRHQMMA